ncbi:MAG: hypothetical protein JWM27_3392 [Gemmatimonadetes bacterium]|nr:hypothetical protein [Gemmatimonadota bacterium]
MTPLREDRSQSSGHDPRAEPSPRRQFARRIDCAENAGRRMAAGGRGGGAPDADRRAEALPGADRRSA